MNKELYIKPEIKTEILEAEVLNTQWGSPGGGNGGNGGNGGLNGPCPGC